MRALQETRIARDVAAASATRDAAAIQSLQQSFERQRRAFVAKPYPSLHERQAQLGALVGMMMQNRGRIRKALSDDFAVHPELFTDLIEVLGVAGRAGYALTQLESWMRDEERYADPTLFGTGKAFIRYQPKGVIGNIVPWNFPFGFGGNGMSGMGRHHGIEGFREFSNPRGVFVRGQGDLADAFYPPYGATLAAITEAAFGPASPPPAKE